MNQRTRTFLIGSATVMLLGLGTGIVAYYSGNLPLGGSQVPNAELTYLPADAVAVAYADVRSIMSSEFRQKLRQLLPSSDEKDKFHAQFGVDIEKDIDTVAAAYMAGATGFDGAVIVIRGRFNEGQIEATALQHGATAQTHGSKRLLIFTEHHGQAGEAGAGHHGAGKSGGVAFLESGVIGLGEESALKRAIDTAASGNDVRKNAELMNLVNDMRLGNAWFVGKFEALTGNPSIPSEVRAHIPAINLVAATVRVNGGVTGAVRAEARDEKAGDQLRDVVRGALAAGQLVSGQDPRVETMLKSLQITGSGKTVGVTFSIPAQMLDVLNGLAAAHGLSKPEAPVKK